jgi:hypothetical protein
MTIIASNGGANHTARRKKIRRTGALIVPPNCRKACICAIHTCIHTTGNNTAFLRSPHVSVTRHCVRSRSVTCQTIGDGCHILSVAITLDLIFQHIHPQFTRDKHGNIRYFLRSSKRLCQYRSKNSPIFAPPSDPSCVNYQLGIKESGCGVATSRHSCNGLFKHQCPLPFKR